MRGNRLSLLRATLAILVVTVFVTSAWAVEEKVLYSFKENGEDGTGPEGLVFDASGNLYGTTYYGGSGSCYDGYGHGCGTVFELTPTGEGWTEKVIYEFSNSNQGGYNPSSGLIVDASGNLYGTASSGGQQGCGYDGTLCGAVFELTPGGGSGWTEKVLHYFSANGKDGANPRAGLIFDAAGNLYGTTWYGGSGLCYDGNGHGCGTVFEVTPRVSGGSVERVLHSFQQNRDDGIWPGTSLIFDASGNLYGTNFEGGTGGYGTVFELTPSAGGDWTEKILHNFASNDGNSPSASLIFDASGDLYGTTYYGPAQGYGGPCNDGYDLGCGTVFELMPQAGGEWTEKILHYFSTNNEDGFNPSSSLVLDPSGNLYGATAQGGAYGGGTVFELKPKAGGQWAERLYSFNGNDGAEPDGGLVFDASGDLYGTTGVGGTDDVGTVFEIGP
jgi:uncharacterized repeat protein (TIGR03803 family)